ncbi:MAG: leucine-rich repeat protein [Oscillospiraceae bacterium]|nr:leucine-rich repeat protein [Oscillospiraceae bacterium]
MFDNINRYEVSGIYNSGFKTYVQDGIRYVRTGKDTARVIDKDKTGIKNLEIPKVIKIFEEEEGIDLNITEIGELVFNYYSGLETIKIPNSVKIIDRKAFSGCKDLKEVVIESDDVIIHSMAFASCPSLEKLTIKGLGTKKVLKHAFFDSPKIELLTEYEYEDVKMLNSETAIEITREEFLRGPKTDVEMRVSFKNGTPYTENNIKYKLYDNKTAVIVGVEDREQLVEVLEIPELVGNNFTVTTISTKAFEGCQNLKKIVIPKTVREIGEKAFLNCNGVIDIIVSGDIEVIKPRTFEQCMKLKTVSFDGVVGQISKDAFYYCTELTEVYLKSDGTISKGAFSACSKIKIELPGNKAAFKDESGIEIYGEEDDDESFSNGPSQDVYIRDKR